jgi:hypothetical protein
MEILKEGYEFDLEGDPGELGIADYKGRVHSRAKLLACGYDSTQKEALALVGDIEGDDNVCVLIGPKAIHQAIMQLPNKKTFYHVCLASKVKSIMARGLIPAIGKHAKETGETEKAVWLFPDKITASDALNNWLGDWYDDKKIALIKVTVPSDFPIVCDSACGGFERRTTEAIPPACLEVDPDPMFQ